MDAKDIERIGSLHFPDGVVTAAIMRINSLRIRQMTTREAAQQALREALGVPDLTLEVKGGWWWVTVPGTPPFHPSNTSTWERIAESIRDQIVEHWPRRRTDSALWSVGADKVAGF